jgi:hypothetical protein
MHVTARRSTRPLWETREGAGVFYRLWGVEDEPGEEAIQLEGDLGLVPLPDSPPG